LGTKLKEAFIKVLMSALTKEAPWGAS
jgi:hypothetical protein